MCTLVFPLRRLSQSVAPWTPITSQFTSIVDSSVLILLRRSTPPEGAVGAFGLGFIAHIFCRLGILNM